MKPFQRRGAGIPACRAEILLGVLSLACAAAAQQPPLAADDAIEQYAFSIGLQAYLYGYPLVISEVSRRQMTAAPINHFHHFTKLVTPEAKSAVSANVDTLMSTAWIDFSGGPLWLDVPDMHGRYYVIQFNDFYTNAFDYIGLRTTGTGPQRYLLTGPDWKGAAPPGAKVIRCPTSVILLVGRVLAGGGADTEAARLQEMITLSPLAPGHAVSSHSAEPPAMPPPEAVARMDVPAFFSTMTELMQRFPPPEDDAALVNQFDRIGIDLEHGFDARKLDAPTMRGLARAVRAGLVLLDAGGALIGGSEVNGWWTPPAAGAFGTDYVLRAYMAANFIWSNAAAESVYPMTSVDEAGRPLTGTHRYVLHFEKNEIPPVDAFWSVTMCDNRRALVENVIHRYSIGSRIKDLHFGPDGSLDLYIQSDSPAGHESNWLPAPPGPFLLTLRLYLPRPEVLNGTYKVPPVVCRTCGAGKSL